MSNLGRTIVAALIGVSFPLLSSSASDLTARNSVKQWSQQRLTPIQRSALEAFHGPDLRSKSGPMHKVGNELTQLFYLDLLSPPLSTAKLKANNFASLPLRETTDSRQFVLVDATASGDAQLLRSQLQQLGAKNLSVYPPIVSGWVPVKALDQIAAIGSLRYLIPSRAFARTGAVKSQGDFALHGPSIRPPLLPGGPTGSGITVAVISGSYNCLGGAGTDVSNGEFPNGVTVLAEEPGCSIFGDDEGRAMLQIVADVAPDASLLFHSGAGGTAAMANAIQTLANNGAKVIVDDLANFRSPWFQDGAISFAISDAVLNFGSAYFSAAGNDAADSYESPFRPSTFMGISGGLLHDFDPSSSERVDNGVIIPQGATARVYMQWDQPTFSACTGCPGSQSDYDIYFVDSTFLPVGIPGVEDNIASGDPVEFAAFTNLGPTAVFWINIERFAGPDAGLIKLIYVDQNPSYQDNTASSTAVGPGLAANAIAVGAAEFYETPACDTSPPVLASFSSRGGVPTLFSGTGARLATPVVRQKPEIVAPQAGNTSFFGQDISDTGSTTRGECLDVDVLPNFGGTSAAAPHAAGVAALLLDAFPGLTPQQLYDGMKSSAIDMLGAGFDFDSGSGLLQADTALQSLADTTPAAFSFTSQAGINPGTQVTSNAVTISGMNSDASVSVSNGEFSVGCNASFTTAAGTIQANQTVCVRHAASAAFNTATTTTLTIGGVNGTFTSTTRVADTTPDPFSFVSQTDVPAPDGMAISNSVTISGIDVPVPISIDNGAQYSIGCNGIFAFGPGMIEPNQSVCVLAYLPGTPNFSVTITLTVGGATGTFTVTTAAADTTPAPFSFTNQTGVAPSAVVTSNTVTITGIDAPAPISVTGGQYSIGCTSTFTASNATISNGQTVCARLTASSAFSTATTATLNVGGVSRAFSATTRAAPPPSGGGGGGGALGFTTLLPLLLLLRRRKYLERT